jgi:hypothetical protein
MIEEIERVAGRSKAPILLTGPTGAGKFFLARRIYELKQERQRLAGRFVEINCATLRGESAMSTTRTGCANTCSASGWIGRRSALLLRARQKRKTLPGAVESRGETFVWKNFSRRSTVRAVACRFLAPLGGEEGVVPCGAKAPDI